MYILITRKIFLRKVGTALMLVCSHHPLDALRKKYKLLKYHVNNSKKVEKHKEITLRRWRRWALVLTYTFELRILKKMCVNELVVAFPCNRKKIVSNMNGNSHPVQDQKNCNKPSFEEYYLTVYCSKEAFYPGRISISKLGIMLRSSPLLPMI